MLSCQDNLSNGTKRIKQFFRRGERKTIPAQFLHFHSCTDTYTIVVVEFNFLLKLNEVAQTETIVS